MNHRRPFGLFVIALVALGLAAPVSAQNRSPDYDSLMDMLANAPDTPRVRAAQIMADYVDYRALEIAVDAPRPGTLEELDALGDEEFANWSTAVSRVEFDPLSVADELPGENLARALPTATSAFRRLPEVLGVDWLEIDRALAADTEGIDSPFILDGYPRTVAAAQHLLGFLGSVGLPVLKVLHLSISKAEMSARAGKRGRADDNEEALRRRFEFYVENVQPSVDR